MTPQDLIQQYATTGQQIPEDQLKQINTNLIKSYIRQRILAQEYGATFQQYEYILAPNEIKPLIIKSISSEQELTQFLNGKTKTHTQLGTYYIYEPKIDFATLVKMILLSYSEENQNPNIWGIKDFIIGMVGEPANQKQFNINTNTQEIYNIILSTPDYGKDKTEMRYLYDMLKTTNDLTPFKTFAKDKLDEYAKILKNIPREARWEKFGYIYKTTPQPKQLIELFNQYDSMGDAFLWYIPDNIFFGLLHSDHPFERVSMIPEKKLIQLLKDNFTKYAFNNPEEHAQRFDNPKEVMQLYNKYSAG
jgi:hypothetical protein